MKKKLLALMLAVVMVAALVPATALSAFAVDPVEGVAGNDQQLGGTGLAQTTPPAVTDQLVATNPDPTAPEQTSTSEGGAGTQSTVTEVPADSTAVAEILNADGIRIANAKAWTNVEALLEDGCTVRLKKDVTFTKAMTLSAPGISWTLDGAGFSIKATAAAIRTVALTLEGAGQKVCIKNLTINSRASALKIGAANTACSLTLENVSLYPGSSSATSLAPTRNNTGSALEVVGAGTEVTVLGDGTYLHGVVDSAVINEGKLTVKGGKIHSNSGVAVENSGTMSVYGGAIDSGSNLAVANSGAMSVYGGAFSSASGAAVVDSVGSKTENTVAPDQGLTVFGGSFVGGADALSVLRVTGGAVVTIYDGSFTLSCTLAESKASTVNLLRAGNASSCGLFVVYGGSFYNGYKHSGIFGSDDASKAYLKPYGGDFYSMENTGLVASKGDPFTCEEIFPGKALAFGVDIDPWYVFEVKEAQEGSYTYRFSLAYNLENPYIKDQSVSLELVSADGSSRSFYACELGYLLACVLKDGDTLYVLSDVAFDQTFSTFVLPQMSADAGWTLAGKDGVHTITSELSGYLLRVNGGSLTLKDIAFVSASGSILSVSNASLIFSGEQVYFAAGRTCIDADGCDIVIPAWMKLGYDKDGQLVGGSLRVGNANCTVYGEIHATGANNALALFGDRTVCYVGKDAVLTSQNNHAVIFEGGSSNGKLDFYGKATVVSEADAPKDAAKSHAALIIYGNANLCNFYAGAAVTGDMGPGLSLNKTSSNANGVLNIYGGLITTKTGARTLQISQPGAICNIYDGTVQSGLDSDARAAWMNASCSLNIYGGTLEGNMTGKCTIGASNGSILIEGGIFTGSKGHLLYTENAVEVVIRNGVLKDADGNELLDEEGKPVRVVPEFQIGGANQGLYIGYKAKDYTGSFDKALVKIEGGYFTGAPSQMIYVVNAALEITGGEFEAKRGNGVMIRSESTAGVKNPVVIKNMSFVNRGRFLDMRSDDQRPITLENVTVVIDGKEALFYYENGMDNLTVLGGDYSITGSYYAIYSVAGTNNIGSRISIRDAKIYTDCDKPLIYVRGKGCDFEMIGGELHASSDIFKLDSNTLGKITFGGDVKVTSTGGAVFVTPADVMFDVTFNGGEFYAATNLILLRSAPWTDDAGHRNMVTINAGIFSYAPGRTLENCIEIQEGICVINGGLFQSNGADVISVGGGEINLSNGAVVDNSTAQLHIFGGSFVLTASDKHTAASDSVIKCGDGTAYGKVTLYGGVYRNDRLTSDQLVLKGSKASSLFIEGGCFIANAVQTNYFVTIGVAGAGAQKLPHVDQNGCFAVDRNGRDASPVSGYYLYAIGYATYPELIGNMVEGATVRLNNDEKGLGLRFTTTYTKEAMALLAAAKEEMGGDKATLQFGTLIVPIDYLVSLNAFTHAGLTEAGVLFVDIVAQDGIEDHQDGSRTIRASLVKIKPENYDRVFCAVGYAKLTAEDGTVRYVYTDFDSISNGRSIYDVATEALADVKDAQDATYQYASILDESKFSPYTKEVQEEIAVFTKLPENPEYPVLPIE